MTDEHGIAGGPHDHAEHGEPDVRHAYGRLPSVPDAQHVAHGLEEGVGILLPPGVILHTEHRKIKKQGWREETPASNTEGPSCWHLDDSLPAFRHGASQCSFWLKTFVNGQGNWYWQLMVVVNET